MLLLLALACRVLTPAPAAPEPPRLVVLVSVDQMVPEQLERLRPVLTGGFRRLLEGGRVYTNARLGYSGTETGPGHATFATGAWPARHRIVGNDWYSRETRGEFYCVGDPDERAVGANGVLTDARRGHVSPRNLAADTLGDRLKRHYAAARVVALSSKDRAAVTMGGHAPDAVVWWDRDGHGLVTGTYLDAPLPPWAAELDAQWIERTSGRRWSPLDRDLAGTRTAADDRADEISIWDAGRRVFPYVLPTATDEDMEQRKALAKAIYRSPHADRMVYELAERALHALELGRDTVPDCLALSFSACDTVGHGHGPYSREVTDLLLRLDQHLGALFELFDEVVGEGRWVVALTADHGVLPLDDVRRRLLPPQLRQAQDSLARALREEFGAELIEDFTVRGVYLDRAVAAEHGLDLALVRRSTAARLARFDWVERTFTSDELAAAPLVPSRRARPFVTGDTPPRPDPQFRDRALVERRRSFDPERSPDVGIERHPGVLTGYPQGTSHGTRHAYDQRIPLVLYGAGIAPGTRAEPAASVDVVPTLLRLLGLPRTADLDGRDLLDERR